MFWRRAGHPAQRISARIFRHFNDVPAAFRGAIVAIGNFDGVHRGHRALIGEAKAQAEARGCPLAVLSFEPHPQEYFRALRQEGGPEEQEGSRRIGQGRRQARGHQGSGCEGRIDQEGCRRQGCQTGSQEGIVPEGRR